MAWLAATVCGLVVGCAGTGSGGTASVSETTAAEPVGIVCAVDATAVELPDDFPDVVPLPEGTVFTSVDERSGGRIVIEAVAPDEFRTTLTFFQNNFPAAGLELEGGEVEERDAESEFRGLGYEGRWKVTDIAECGDTRIELVVAPA